MWRGYSTAYWCSRAIIHPIIYLRFKNPLTYQNPWKYDIVLLESGSILIKAAE